MTDVLSREQIMSEREALVRKILLGIDETENESEHGWWETSSGAEFGKKKLDELIAALTAQPQQEPVGDTGNPEADRIINRLMSDDPDFDDCIEAATFIRKLVVEHRGPDGFATWKDAAIAERLKRTAPPSGVQPTDGRASMQAELGAALGSALSHYKSGDMQACAASLVRIVDLFRDVTPQPADGVVVPREPDVLTTHRRGAEQLGMHRKGPYLHELNIALAHIDELRAHLAAKEQK